MRNIKKVLIGTALAGSLVVGAGYGTYSWFTAETSSTGTIVNGTLSLGHLSDLFTNQTLAPSQIVESNLLTIDHNGSSLDKILKATYSHTITPIEDITLGNDDNKAVISKYKVYYFAIKYKEKPKKQVIIDTRDNLYKLINGTSNPGINKAAVAGQGYEVVQGELSAQEVQGLMANKQASTTEKTITIGNGDKDSFWTLNQKQHIDVQFLVKLDNSAGNEYQGLTYNATFKVEAKQTEPGAKFPSQINGN
jgi:spore coat-associated protein N